MKEGVDTIFGYPGGAILPFYDALYHYPQIRHVLVRHEQAAAHAAEAYSRVSGKVGVCVATSGPGATNLMTGLLAAKMDSTPMVAITGQVARPFMGTEAFQECDTIGMAKPAVKKAYLVMDVRELAATFQEAFRFAQEGRPGPVLIDIPKDVQAETFDFAYPEPVNNHTGPEPDTALVEEAARLLNAAERPLLIVGRGVHIARAWDELQSLAEKVHAPVLNTLHGTSAFPRHHPLGHGMLGMHGMYASNLASAEADLVMGVGMRFDDRVIGRPGTFAPNAKVVHLEIRPKPDQQERTGRRRSRRRLAAHPWRPAAVGAEPAARGLARTAGRTRARPPQHRLARLGHRDAAVRAARAQQDRRAQR